MSEENDTQKPDSEAVDLPRLVHPSGVATKLKNAANLGARMVYILDIRNAHMEGRIRFYLECAEGKRPAINLAECIREDLKRLKADRSDSYGMNTDSATTH